MSSQAIHHMVTIRLEEHVEQLEKAYRALLAVRVELDDAQDAMVKMEPEASGARKTQTPLSAIRRAAGMVHAALKDFELPCAGAAAEQA